MRDTFSKGTILSVAAGAALLAAACGDTDTAASNAADDLGSDMVLDAPGNDASAMESVANAADPAANGAAGDNSADTGGAARETSGGDTGGNTLPGNVSAM